MTQEELYKQIEDYLEGVLSKDKKAAFEKQLSTDAGLARKVKLHKLADELVIERRLQNVNQLLIEEKNKGKWGNSFKIIFGAVCVVAGTSLFITWKTKHTITESAPVAINKNIEDVNVVKENNEIATTNSKKTITAEVRNVSSSQINVTEWPVGNLASENNSSNITTNKEITPIQKTLESKEPIQSLPVADKNNTGPCASIQLDAKVSATASCRGESNGSIVVREFAGGTAPYAVSIQNKQEEHVASFNLPAGQYSVQIQDKKGCSHTIPNIHVPEKICEKQYNFNPFMDELLVMPAQEQYSTLAVYERSGNLYFTKEVEPLQEIQWNGYSKNGELNAGYFIFVLTLKDGRAFKGGITIAR